MWRDWGKVGVMEGGRRGGVEGWLSVSQGSQRERKKARRAHPLQRNSTGGKLFVLERKKENLNTLDSNTVITETRTLHISAGGGALFRWMGGFF